METAEVTTGQPGDDGIPAPEESFVVIVGDSVDGGSAFRVQDPARLLRVWLILQATLGQLETATLPPKQIPGMQRQLQVIRRELECAVSAPLAAELQRILPPRDAAPTAGTLRIEYAVLASWAGSLVARMLTVFVAARERSDRAVAEADAMLGSRV